ncbi:hypothetical protein D3C81_1629880 [compost metagenome]
MGHATDITHDHAKAVIQRHRDHQAIELGQSQTLTNHVTVVEDVVVAERRPLWETRGAGGVLDVHRLVELQAALTCSIVSITDGAGQFRQLTPGQETHRWLLAQADHPAQLGQQPTAQLPRRLLGQFGQQAREHFMVIGGFERAGADQPLATGLLEHVLELTAAVGRVDVDQDRTDFRTGELGNRPLCTVGRPDAQPVTGLQPQGLQGAGMNVDRFGQLPPGVT